ncbi:MAG: flagellar assembly protein FliH [Burkholderiales bacterium]|nr:flagellar assembly protein FliH [Burkholderiales bacterium]
MSGAGKPPPQHVPPVAGRAAGQGGNGKATGSYARFIPREELGEVASWKPGSFGAGAAAFGAAAGTAPASGTAAADSTPDALRARLDAERHALRQAAYQEGYRDGLVALENFKQHFAAQATAQIGSLLDSFDAQLREIDAQAAQALTRCTLQLARQVVRSELGTRPELVARVATDAVNAVMLSASHIRVLAHPADLPLIEEGAQEALVARGARLLPDENVERGGVIVESDAGAVDARVATRWAQAAAALGSEVAWAADDDA